MQHGETHDAVKAAVRKRHARSVALKDANVLIGQPHCKQVRKSFIDFHTGQASGWIDKQFRSDPKARSNLENVGPETDILHCPGERRLHCPSPQWRIAQPSVRQIHC